MAMPVIVIAIFRPKPGKTDELLCCLRDHMPLMRAAGGEILEVFE